MAVIVGIDPGLRACGVAVASASSASLLGAWLTKSPERKDDGARAWLAMARAVELEVSAFLTALEDYDVALAVVERQMIRAFRGPGGKMTTTTKNPSQILGLASVAGALLASVRARMALSVWPSEWMGNMRQQGRRFGSGPDGYLQIIWRGLDERERRRVRGAELKTTGHNVLDAIGIARWAAKRHRLALL